MPVRYLPSTILAQILGWKYIGAGIRYQGSRTAQRSTDFVYLPSYALFDVNAGYEAKKWGAGLNDKNLFDRRVSGRDHTKCNNLVLGESNDGSSECNLNIKQLFALDIIYFSLFEFNAKAEVLWENAEFSVDLSVKIRDCLIGPTSSQMLDFGLKHTGARTCDLKKPSTSTVAGKFFFAFSELEAITEAAAYWLIPCDVKKYCGCGVSALRLVWDEAESKTLIKPFFVFGPSPYFKDAGFVLEKICAGMLDILKYKFLVMEKGKCWL
ncbi:hypothetical protein FQA39_LY19304 [Lamprigera yunnana]|nr:hypothetical protein FQA39_LY19304 [Lamprigera yunnana]